MSVTNVYIITYKTAQGVYGVYRAYTEYEAALEEYEKIRMDKYMCTYTIEATILRTTAFPSTALDIMLQ